MSQPQNLRADELHHHTPVTALKSVAQPSTEADDARGLSNIATPRLRAVRDQSVRSESAEQIGSAGHEGSAEHVVPATVEYAGSMTEGALALRLQAITRLGVVSAAAVPTQLATTSGAAATDAAAVAGAAAVTAAARRAVQGTITAARALAAAPSAGAVIADETAGQEPTLVVIPADGTTAPAPSSAPAKRVRRAAPAKRPEAPRVGPAVPEARAWASRLVQAVSEVLAGDRPISQLVRFTDEAVFGELNRRVRMLGLTTTATTRGAKGRSAVRSVRVCLPADDVAEVAAHVRHGDRSRAIALRMEIRRNRWVCTALELG